MPTSEDEVQPLTEARLTAECETGLNEADSPEENQDVRSHLAEFYEHELGPDELCLRLQSSMASVIKEAQLSLIKSLSLGLRPAWFRTTKAAILQLEQLKTNQHTDLLERELSRIAELQKIYRSTLERTLQEMTEQESRNREPTITPGRWIAAHGTLSVDGDFGERLAESQLEADRLYGEEFASTVRRMTALVELED